MSCHADLRGIAGGEVEGGGNCSHEITKEVKELKDRKSDKILYRLPAVNLCSWSLI